MHGVSATRPSNSLGLLRAPTGQTSAQGLMAASAILFGIQGVFAELAYDNGASVGVVLALRAAVFSLLGLFLLDPARRATLHGHWRVLSIACFTSIAGPLLYYGALASMQPTTVTLIVFLYPALTIVGARLLGRIHLSALAIGVTAVTMIGVALAVGAPVGGVNLSGVLLALSSSFVFSIYFLAAEHGLEGVDPLAWLGVTVIAAAVVLVPVAPLLGISLPNGKGFAAILMIAIGCSLVPCLLQTAGLMRLGSAAATLVATVEIATVVVASTLILGQRPTPLAVIGAVLVIIGAACAPMAMRDRLRPPSTTL